MTCVHTVQTERMATKMRILKLLQEIRGLAQITNRRPQPKAPGLFLIQLRTHLTQSTPSRQKLVISVDMQNPPDLPHPVKITHLKPTAPERAAAQAQ